MSDSSIRAARANEAKYVRQLEEVAAARSDVNNVAVFTKLIKKAEEISQAAV
ncbi:hypothetical protein SAMN05518865_106255 [Duganella sp. CF458]|uniref:hypothetical protein n=1 Tax=Duganella sp. CF458 TaxID=1884368 RepID=UPI0008E12EBD|nr:hypothetical protein [Duganella sp. CF458]SFF95263.1 hypothetical protein SAMN05518865_106255 [Duganella sp. CF458]